MESDSGGVQARVVANNRRLILKEQMELFIEAAIALRDILMFVEDPDEGVAHNLVYRTAAERLRQAANRIERMQEVRRRAVAILEQLGLKP